MNDRRIHDIPLNEILFDQEFNCRGKIAAIDVVDLVNDIRTRNGLIQPVTVTPLDDDRAKKTGCKYLLVAGYRRYMAHRVLVWDKIDSIIRTDMVDQEQACLFNLSENLQRKDLNVLQEAKAIQRLHDLGVSEVDTATKLNKSRGWVQVRYMLLKLPKEVQNEVAGGFIPQSGIRDLFTVLRYGNEEKCFEAARKIKDAKLSGRKAQLDSLKKKKLSNKRHRKRAEIFEMMNHMMEFLPAGLYSRCLAWCAGEISDMDLYETIHEHCESEGTKNNRVYMIPSQESTDETES